MRAITISIALITLSPAYSAQDTIPEAMQETQGASSITPSSLEPALRLGEIGTICGLSDVVGQPIHPIYGQRQGCSIANPVRVVRVGGIKLSQPTTTSCQTVIALRFWVETGVKPILDRFGWKAERLEVAGGYVCKTINNIPGGDISEHGKGRAIDIVGLGLSNGHTITVSDGWQRRVERQVLRRLHRAACGPFKTVLGPEADSFHQNHFHFDVKPRRSLHCR